MFLRRRTEMNDLTLENIQQFFESAAKANADAWASQTSYFEALVKRNTRLLTRLLNPTWLLMRKYGKT
jgi:hypothetical protein